MKNDNEKKYSLDECFDLLHINQKQDAKELEIDNNKSVFDSYGNYIYPTDYVYSEPNFIETYSSRENYQLKKEIIELNDTIKLMVSADYKDRFKAEYYQAKIRYDKLGEMLKKYEKNELNFKPKCSYTLLLNQYKLMGDYLAILILRAGIEEVRLED